MRRARMLPLSTRRSRDYGADDFFAAFQFAPESVAIFREGARRIGML